ncbi:acyl-CoA dehydrogenase family protein [Actinomadura sp. 9N215]|uniref:acyl-CoA dehydrogenase family protein n=1 Tax=Actinomadura sp. 9N215 TaxID=3375150 RepID=UPI00378F6005
MQEVSLAKAWVSEAYERVCVLGHQVHGAIGFTAEHDPALVFPARYVRVPGLR